MDSMIQLGLLQRDTRSIFIPTSIDRIVVDAPKHIAFAKTMKDNMLPVYANKDVGIFM